MRSLRRCLLLLVSFCALASGAAAKTVLVLDGDPGEPVSGGGLQTFLPANGPFSALRNGEQGVSVTFDGVGDWFLDFAADGGLELEPQLYPNAVRYGDNAAGQNGLRIALGGGCDPLSGAFEVHEVAYGAGDAVTSFAADFVQVCAFSSKRLSGAIRFDASDALPDAFDEDGDGAIEIGDNCPGLPNETQNDDDQDLAGDACDPSREASFVLFDSEEGDYIGQGVRRHFNASGTAFELRADSGELGVHLEGEEYFDLLLAAPGGVAPGVGVYEGATRFGSDTEPQLNVSGDGRGCNQVAGRFQVFEAEYAPNGEVLRFSADFEQHCEGGDPALFGSVRWRAAFRPAPPADIEGDGWLLADDNCPGVPNPAQFDTDGDGRGDFCGLAPVAQKCVNDFNKGTAAVAKAQGASNLACLKNAQKGVTAKLGVPATAQDCLSNDVGLKVAKSVAKLAAKEATSCSGGSEFGYTSGAVAGDAAGQAGRNLMADLFGANLDTAIVAAQTDAIGAKCREEVAKRTQGAVDALWKLTLEQKKALLLGKKVLAPTTSADLAAALTAYLESDPKGAVTKPFAAIATGAGKRCTAVSDLAAAFPGCAPADLPALNACAERSARCRFCQVLAVADGLATLDCDLFDDDTADLSCQQTP